MNIHTNQKRIDYIEDKIEESNSPHPRTPPIRQSINELVTKSIMNVVSGKNRAEELERQRIANAAAYRESRVERQAASDRVAAQWAREQSAARAAEEAERIRRAESTVDGIVRRAHLTVDMQNSAAEFRARRELQGGNSQDVLRREIDRRNTPSRAELQQRLDALKDT